MRKEKKIFIIGLLLIITGIVLFNNYSFFLAGIGVTLIGGALLLAINEKGE